MRKILLFLLLSVVTANAQVVTLDPQFNTGTGPNFPVQVMKQLPDGKILIGGQFTQYNGVETARLIRLNADGTHDASFVSAFQGFVTSIVVEADGKIVVAGEMSGMMRLNPNGSADVSFTPPPMGGGFGPYWVVKQNDKYLVLGDFSTFHGSGTLYNKLVRLNYDGTVDPTFAPTDFGNTLSVAELFLQPDGKIILYGSFNYYNGSQVNSMIRLNGNGTLDTSFNAGTDANGIIRDAILMNDGKYLVSGQFNSFNNVPKNLMARLNADGSLDNSFNYTNAIGLPEDGIIGWDLYQQPDNKILVAGIFRDAMIDFEGPDDGSIPIYFVRLNADGSTDTNFNAEFDDDVYAIEIQSDGKVLVGGWFSFLGDEPIENLARLNYNVLSVSSYKPDLAITAFPNPTREILNINVTSAGDILQNITITDLSGKIVHQSVHSASAAVIDLRSLQSGVYILKVVSGGEVALSKIVKQ